MNVEQWKPVVGFEGAYEVSDLGRVRSLPRRVQMGSGWRVTRAIVLRPKVRKNGYLEVVLTGQVSRLVHRLVLEAFVGPCTGGMECLHGNDERTDAALKNLRWGTHKENGSDMATRQRAAAGERHGKSVLTQELAGWARESTQTLAALAHGLGVGINTARRARLGQTYAS